MPECSVAISHVVCFRRCVTMAKSIGIAALAVVTTNIAAATGMLTYLSLDALYGKKSTLGAMNGAITGLVCITAGRSNSTCLKHSAVLTQSILGAPVIVC